MNELKTNKISVTIEALCRKFPDEFVKYFEHCRNLGFEDKPDYSRLRRGFSELMNNEGYTYDYQYDWLLKKSERQALLASDDTKVDDEDKEEKKIMTKAEKFRMTTQSKFKPTKDMLESGEDSKTKPTADKTNLATADKSKAVPKIPSSKRKTFNSKGIIDKDDKKKPDIYEAMKDAGFSIPQPKIVTNNARGYYHKF